MKYLVAACVLGLLAGGQPASAQTRASTPVGFRAQGNGTLVHIASGTEFPQTLGSFTRTLATPLDHAGSDVVVSYRYAIGSQPVIARIALLHVAMMKPREHFIAMRPLVGTYFKDEHFSNITPTGDAPLLVNGIKRGSGWRGQFSATRDGKPYELSLSTLKFGYWSARLTAAYPVSDAREARQRLADLAVGLARTVPQGRTPK